MQTLPWAVHIRDSSSAFMNPPNKGNQGGEIINAGNSDMIKRQP